MCRYDVVRCAGGHQLNRAVVRERLAQGAHHVLDRWENARIGASVPRFVERIARTERVIVCTGSHPTSPSMS